MEVKYWKRSVIFVFSRKNTNFVVKYTFYMTAQFDIQYLTDMQGQKQGVQMSLTEWEKVMAQLRYYEQFLRLKTDLKEAFEDVKAMQGGKIKKQTLSNFLNEV